MSSGDIFKNKKVTVMGLGLLGGLLNDIIFLAEKGAILTVTDLKNAEILKPSLDKLEQYKNIKFVLGEHRLEDFRGADFILHSGNVPTDSLYLAEARKNNIPIYVGESLFAKHTEGAVLVGITGTRGKSTVTQMVYEILKKSPPSDGARVFLGGNVRDVSTLALLDKVRPGDFVVLELDSWALAGMGDVKISPHVAVFTTFMQDHMNYYKGDMMAYLRDKANIFKYQTPHDILVLGSQADRIIEEKYSSDILARKYVASDFDIPHDWKLKMPGIHNRYNAGIAKVVAEELSIPDDVIKEVIVNFRGLPFRLEFVREVNGVKFYNDSNSTSPEAVIAALKSFPDEKIILIAGGTDKNLDVGEMAEQIHEKAKELVLLSGSGTDRLKEYLVPGEYIEVDSLSDAVLKVQSLATGGDVVVFSPGFSSFEKFKNEYDRGEQFTNIVNKIK